MGGYIGKIKGGSREGREEERGYGWIKIKGGPREVRQGAKKGGDIGKVMGGSREGRKGREEERKAEKG